MKRLCIACPWEETPLGSNGDTTWIPMRADYPDSAELHRVKVDTAPEMRIEDIPINKVVAYVECSEAVYQDILARTDGKYHILMEFDA